MLQRRRAAGIVIDNDKVLLMHRLKEGNEYYVVPGADSNQGRALKKPAYERCRKRLVSAFPLNGCYAL